MSKGKISENLLTNFSVLCKVNKTKDSPKPLAPRCEKFKIVNTDTMKK